jgi:cytochrome c peroxidase
MRLFLFFNLTIIVCLILNACNTQQAIPQQEALVTTGRYLFYDRRLSINNTKACGTCHAQQFSFTDGYTRSIGALGDLHQRNAKPLFNLNYNRYFTAGDSSVKTLLQQMEKPMFGKHPIEMGMDGNELAILKRLQSDTLYKRLFTAAFPLQKNVFTISNIKIAIDAFEKTILSLNSPYDHFFRGDTNALSQEQKIGKQLFFSNKLKCYQCHNDVNFTSNNLNVTAIKYGDYFNTGLFTNTPTDMGLYESTHNIADKNKFRIPTLRNLAFTAPYYHNGSTTTLLKVIENYEQGGNKYDVTKSDLITGFSLTLPQREALVSFLLSLSDSSVLTNPAYANPFTYDETKN